MSKWWGPLDVPPAPPPVPVTPAPPAPGRQDAVALARIEMILDSILSATLTLKGSIQKLRATLDPTETAAFIADMQQTTDALAKSIANINPPTTGA